MAKVAVTAPDGDFQYAFDVTWNPQSVPMTDCRPDLGTGDRVRDRSGQSPEARRRREQHPQLTARRPLSWRCDCRSAGMLDAAEEIYRRVLEAVPDHVDALHFLGISATTAASTTRGWRCCGGRWSWRPTTSTRATTWATCCSSRSPRRGRGRLPAGAGARPDHVNAHANLGSVLRRRGDLAGAEAEFRRAIELDARSRRGVPQPGRRAARHRARRRGAGRVPAGAGAAAPTTASPTARVGAMLYALGRSGEALAIYERWLELEPNSPIAQHMICACSRRRRRAGARLRRVRAADVRRRSRTASTSSSSGSKYRAPALVADAVARARGRRRRAALDVLDAGAGTGWCGADAAPLRAAPGRASICRPGCSPRPPRSRASTTSWRPPS